MLELLGSIFCRYKVIGGEFSISRVVYALNSSQDKICGSYASKSGIGLIEANSLISGTVFLIQE